MVLIDWKESENGVGEKTAEETDVLIYKEQHKMNLHNVHISVSKVGGAVQKKRDTNRESRP